MSMSAMQLGLDLA